MSDIASVKLKYDTLKLPPLAYGVYTHTCVFLYSFIYAKDRGGKRDYLFIRCPTGRLYEGLTRKLPCMRLQVVVSLTPRIFCQQTLGLKADLSNLVFIVSVRNSSF